MITLKLSSLSLFFVISVTCSAQSHDLLDSEQIEKAKTDFKEYSIVKPETSFSKNYIHLEGKIGNSKTTIDMNMQLDDRIAYFFCDSINDIIEYSVINTGSSFVLIKSDGLFWSSKDANEKIVLIPTNQNCFVGYVLNTNNITSKCIFKETYTNGNLKFSNLSFAYNSSYKKFPTSLTENILFADANTITGKLVNAALVKNYDYICANYEDDIKNISFRELYKWKTADSFETYSKKKFIKCYKNIIDSDYLNDANESGHTDIFGNDLFSQILWNDGKYLVLEITIWFTDGISYPYYDTYFFEYDLEKKEILSEKYLNSLLKKQINDSLVISKLKEKNIYDSNSDDFFIEQPKIAFITKKGVVLFRKGGNHGIQVFLKYYSSDIIKPLLEQ